MPTVAFYEKKITNGHKQVYRKRRAKKSKTDMGKTAKPVIMLGLYLCSLLLTVTVRIKFGGKIFWLEI